jgi:hypothetical protein
MRPVTVTSSGVSRSAVIVPDIHNQPVNISLAAIVSGAATYNVEYTYDDVFATNPAFNPATATWFVHATFNAATTTKDGNIAFPVTGISINQTAGAGGVSLKAIEAGIGGL